MTRAWRLAAAFLRRDLATDLSYKASLLIEAADILIAVAAYYYLSHAIAPGGAGGYDAAGFLLVGLAGNSAMTALLTCFALNVKTDIQQGALKPVLMAPLPPSALVACGSVYPIVRAAVGAAAYLAAGRFFGVSYAGARLVPLAAISLASFGTFTALGLFSAAAVFLLKRGDPIVWMFSALSWLLGGVFVPVSLLPAPLQRLAAWLPITHVVDALRQVVLRGATLADIRAEVFVLSAITVFGVPAGVLAVQYGIDRAKREGTLAHT